MYDIDSTKVNVDVVPLGRFGDSLPQPARYAIEPGDGTRYSILALPITTSPLEPIYLQSWGTLAGAGFVIVELLHGNAAFIPAGDWVSFFDTEEALKVKNPCTTYWLTFLIARATGNPSEIEKYPNSKDWFEELQRREKK